jgi:hypothetical protein
MRSEASSKRLDVESLGRWLDAYGRAWESGDAAGAAALYSEDVKYYETPFDEPEVGTSGVREYTQTAVAAQRDVRFWHEPLGVTHNFGIARWGATFVRVPSGISVELDGIFVLTFDEHGKCSELREWWHRRETPEMTEG